MDWLTEIIKQLQTSHAFVSAVFVVCISILLGHSFIPSIIPQVPDEWKLPLIGGLLFSSTLLLFLIIPYIWKYFSKSINNKTQEVRALSLSDHERSFLYNLAVMIEDSREDFLNLGSLDYSIMNASKLELQEIVTDLSNKGLIDINFLDPNLISFTSKGRTRALEIKNSTIQSRRLR